MLWGLSFALVWGASGDALAQSAQDKSAALALVSDGKQLVDVGKAEEACPKFVESQRLSPDTKTHYYVADCFERTGKAVSAWTHFLALAEECKAAGQSDKEKYARERAEALSKTLPRVEVRVSSEAQGLAGITVSRDDEAIGMAQWGTAVPVDPGQHVVRARATGRKAWEQKIDAKLDGKAFVVTIPLLEIESAPAPVAAAAPVSPAPSAPHVEATPQDNTSAEAGPSRRTLGFVTLAVGGAGLVLGGVMGGLAIAKHGDLVDSCPDGHCAPSQQDALQSDVDGYETLGLVSTIGFIAGGALAAAGAVLIFTAPDEQTRTGTVAPLVGIGFVGAKGSF